jgi:hypothetical protein
MLAGDQSTSTGGAAAGSNGTLAYVGTFSGEIELANGPLVNPGTATPTSSLLAPAP